MRIVRFLRNTDLRREGADFKQGQTVALKDASAARWLRRGAAEYVVGTVADATTLTDEKPVFIEIANGDVLDSAADVAGSDSGDSGVGAEHVAEPVQPRKRGRPAKHSDK